MTQSHVLSGLIAKRAELAGQVEMLQKDIRALVLAIDHIDATIRVFDPEADIEDIKPKLPPRHSAFRGEVTRLVLTALRRAGKPLPVSEITLQVAAGRGLTEEDRMFLRVLSRRVGACLRNLRKKGLVRAIEEPGKLQHWEIVR